MFPFFFFAEISLNFIAIVSVQRCDLSNKPEITLAKPP